MKNNPKVATIVPLLHLNLTSDDQYFMALSCAASNSDYIRFFRQRSEDPECYTILDNSAVELGEPEKFEDYLEKAHEMKVSQIMLPDFFKDASRTIWAARGCLEQLDDLGHKGFGKFDLMVVPQGKTFEEWRDCALRMAFLVLESGAYRHFVTIGVSCRYTDLFMGTREPAVRTLEAFFGGISKKIRIHLLGCYVNPRVDVAPVLSSLFVQGVDSSYPTVYTQHGYEMSIESLNFPRPARNIDFVNDLYNPSLLEKNAKLWRWACYNTIL